MIFKENLPKEARELLKADFEILIEEETYVFENITCPTKAFSLTPWNVFKDALKASPFNLLFYRRIIPKQRGFEYNLRFESLVSEILSFKYETTGVMMTKTPKHCSKKTIVVMLKEL
jgi:hypothetical protein